MDLCHIVGYSWYQLVKITPRARTPSPQYSSVSIFDQTCQQPCLACRLASGVNFTHFILKWIFCWNLAFVSNPWALLVWTKARAPSLQYNSSGCGIFDQTCRQPCLACCLALGVNSTHFFLKWIFFRSPICVKSLGTPSMNRKPAPPLHSIIVAVVVCLTRLASNPV